MYKKLIELGIELNKNQIKTFDLYQSLFLEFNEKINLIGKNDEQNLFYKHIWDSLALNLYLKDNTNVKSLMDIGTGGGFPALPLAIAFPEKNFIAVDSINKKINVLNSIIKSLSLKNIKAKTDRIEDLPYEYKNSFDMVTSRAMAELRMILEYAIPYIKIGGYFAAYKALKAKEELENAQSALNKLNTKLIKKIEYTLPIEENPKRVLLIFKKLKAVDDIYPRKNGAIKKNPL